MSKATLISVWSAFGLTFLAGNPLPAQPVGASPDRVDLSTRRAVDFLWSKQGRDGRWVSEEFEGRFAGGLTALSALALRATGVPASDHRLQLAAKSLIDRDMMRSIYARAFTLMLWCALDPNRRGGDIEEDIRFLTMQQHSDGAWGHGLRAGRGSDRGSKDNSNTQIALLALSQARQAGFEVSDIVWRRAERSWLQSQNEDGGWGYSLADADATGASRRDSQGSMTAAGIASLRLIHDAIYAEAELPFNGRGAARCGQDHKKTRPIRAAIDRAEQWMDEHFRVDAVPGIKTPSPSVSIENSLTFYLYCVDRAGIASGRKRYGDTVWHRALAEQLIGRQAADGSWGGVQETAMGLLALQKARTPVVLGKLQYGDGKDWNNDPRDAEHLVAWYSRQIDTPLAWQVVDVDHHPGDIFDAPVLLITGHDAPEISEAAHSVLREYVWSGGTILGVACCSRTTFANGFAQLMETLFPQMESAPLPADHPVWTMLDPLEPDLDLVGMSDGCRTSIFLQTAGACCAWNQNRPDRNERLFQLGGGILRYATHAQPPVDRLTPPDDPDVPSRTGSLTVARLSHGGDWRADPRSLHALSNRLERTLGLHLDEIPRARAGELRRLDADVVWLTGHQFTLPSGSDRVEIRSYLVNGGMMFASACCGRQAFDDAFQPWAEALFGPDRWELIPPDDPLMTGSLAPGVASSLHALSYKRGRDGAAPARLDWPVLRGIRHNDRWMLVYSSYDVSCGISGHPRVVCIGYEPRDAEAIAANVMLYAAVQREQRATDKE